MYNICICIQRMKYFSKRKQLFLDAWYYPAKFSLPPLHNDLLNTYTKIKFFIFFLNKHQEVWNPQCKYKQTVYLKKEKYVCICIHWFRPLADVNSPTKSYRKPPMTPGPASDRPVYVTGLVEASPQMDGYSRNMVKRVTFCLNNTHMWKYIIHIYIYIYNYIYYSFLMCVHMLIWIYTYTQVDRKKDG